MNILFSCDEYPPLCTGGIGTATATVAEGLSKRGNKVFVVSGWINDYNLPFVSIQNGVTIYRIKYFQRLNHILTRHTFLNRIIRFILTKTKLLPLFARKEWEGTNKLIATLIKENNIDIIEIPDYNVLTNYISDNIKIQYPQWNVPAVARVHGSKSFLTYYATGRINPLTSVNDYNFFTSSYSILSVSHFAADFVNKILGVERNIDVIYNPMNSRFIRDVNLINHDRNNEIIFIGKIIETKGAFNLIKAFNTFVETHQEYRLIMIGDGEINKAKSLATSKALHKIVFTGYITEDKIRHYLQNAAFAVIPSYFETLGQAAIEILSYGNILIYTKEATGKEIIDNGQNGFLVNPYDVTCILEKMNYVADNIQSLSFMRINAAKSIADRFSEDLIISQLEQYYLKTIYDYNKKD